MPAYPVALEALTSVKSMSAVADDFPDDYDGYDDDYNDDDVDCYCE